MNYLLNFLIFLLLVCNLLTEVLIITKRSLIGPDILQFLWFFSLFSHRFKAIKIRISWYEKTFYFAKTQVFWRLGHTAVAYNISFSVS